MTHSIKLMALACTLFFHSPALSEPIFFTKIHLANQNQLPVFEFKSDPLGKKVLLDTFTISGWGLTAGKNQTYATFVNANLNTLEKNFHRYISKLKKNLTPNFQGSLLLDIEHPVHLIKLSELTSSDLALYIRAINLRVRMVKEFFPKAEIGLYGLFVPYQQCGIYKADKKRLLSFKLGLENGILENLDYITVVSYLRWESSLSNDDPNICIAQKANLIAKLAKKYNIPYRPLLSLRIYNKKSSSDREFVNYKNQHDKLYKSLLAQAKLFHKEKIHDILIWHPNDTVKPENDDTWSQYDIIEKLSADLK